MKTRTIFRLLICSLVLVSSLSGQETRKAEESLSVQHKDWLDLATYIILPQEREVFLTLTDDRDRDIFIESFWKQRDPTPGTPQNEFKDEHIRRFRHANSQLGRGTSKPGWMTDQGRIYIILGPPHSTDDFSGTAGLLNCEVWYYYGDPLKNLPTHFGLIFFRKGNAGPYRLYDPVSDGPTALLENPSPRDLTEIPEVYGRIYQEAPDLAPLTLSLIPGSVPYNFQPSSQSSLILSRIHDAAKKDVRTNYATHFLSYKGVVTTEYLTNFVECEGKFVVFHDPVLDMAFLHFSISPETFSVDYFAPEDRYFSNFELDVSLRREDTVVYQFTKEFPLYFPEEEAKGITAGGISIQDAFPVAEGNFQLTVLYKNSVGKEFSVLERNIKIPGLESTRITGPFLGYRMEEDKRDIHTAFKVLHNRIYSDPKDTFAGNDAMAVLFGVTGLTRDLWESGTAEIRIRGLQDNAAHVKTERLRLSDFPFRQTVLIPAVFSARDFPPDYYEMILRLLGPAQTPIDERLVPFIISPKPVPARPRVISRTLPRSGMPMLTYALASQYDALDIPARAAELYEKAFSMEPGFDDGVIAYARFLLKTADFEGVLSLAERWRDRNDMKFAYHLFRGKALLGQGLYTQALEDLLKGNRIYDSDIELLNALGFCYYKMDRRSQALEALRASLQLNPNQDGVKALVAELSSKKQRPD
jgi:GWxTD domain-containing protein